MPPTHTFTSGDRYVWTAPAHPDLPPKMLTGAYVADGPAPFVTVRHDGWDRDAQVFADQLAPESAP